jgi:hypothetical protein
MRILGANAEVVVPFKEPQNVTSVIHPFFSYVGASTVKVYVENGNFVSKDYPTEELPAVFLSLLERKPMAVGATLVKGNISDTAKRGLIHRAKIKQGKENCLELSTRSFFPSELKQNFALKLGTAIQKGDQPDLDPLLRTCVDSLRRSYDSLKKNPRIQIDSFYEINYSDRKDLSRMLQFFEENFFDKDEEVLMTCFETIKADDQKIQCEMDEDTYLRREKLIPGKVAALVEKYVVCSLMTPNMKIEIDHWIELNTLIFHLTSGEKGSREKMLNSFFDLWKFETEKNPISLPIFESILKEGNP